MRSSTLSILMVWLGLSGPAVAQATKESAEEPSHDKQVEENRKVLFPNTLPNNITPLDKVMLDKVNSLGTKKTQVEFLVSLLPPKDKKEKTLTDDQLTAINLLGMSQSDDAVASLLDMLEFTHKRSGAAAAQGLAHLGERSTEPLVAELGTTNHRRLNMVVFALRDLHGPKFGEFVEALKMRKDVKLTPAASDMLRTFVESKINF